MFFWMLIIETFILLSLCPHIEVDRLLQSHFVIVGQHITINSLNSQKDRLHSTEYGSNFERRETLTYSCRRVQTAPVIFWFGGGLIVQHAHE